MLLENHCYSNCGTQKWAYWNCIERAVHSLNREKEHRDLRGRRLLYKDKEGSQWYNKERCKFEGLIEFGILCSITMGLKEMDKK